MSTATARHEEVPCKIELPPTQLAADWEPVRKEWLPASDNLKDKSDFWVGAGYWRGFFAALLFQVGGYWFASRSRKREVHQGAKAGLLWAFILLTLVDLWSFYIWEAESARLGYLRGSRRSEEANLVWVLTAVVLSLGAKCVGAALGLALWATVFKVARRFMYPVAVILLMLVPLTGSELIFWFSMTPIFFAYCHRSNQLALCRHYLSRARFAVDDAVGWISFVLGLALPPLVVAIFVHLVRGGH